MSRFDYDPPLDPPLWRTGDERLWCTVAANAVGFVYGLAMLVFVCVIALPALCLTGYACGEHRTRVYLSKEQL